MSLLTIILNLALPPLAVFLKHGLGSFFNKPFINCTRVGSKNYTCFLVND